MVVNEEKCIEYVMNTYGVNKVGAKDLLDDFGLWEDVQKIIEKEE